MLKTIKTRNFKIILTFYLKNAHIYVLLLLKKYSTFDIAILIKYC